MSNIFSHSCASVTEDLNKMAGTLHLFGDAASANLFVLVAKMRCMKLFEEML